MMAEKFEQWANVELMGHQRVVGRCTEELIAGHPMLRVDIPVGAEFSTRYYGSSAIYCLTVVSEDVARKLCSRLSQEPSFVWDLRDHSKAVTYGSAHPGATGEDDADDRVF
jgi:hypothetical protein